MGSRYRTNVKHFFECFCEIVPPTSEKDAWIIQQYPDNYKDEEVLKSVPKFAYPYKFENSVIQHYSFVLTDLQSKFTFGFCRHDPKSETALVVLSYLPWHQALYKFLDNIAVLMHSPRADDLRDFLVSVFTHKLPDPGRTVTITFNGGESIFAIECPKKFQLPSIPENRNLTEYYNAVSSHNMMVVFASMLFERRIIVTSKKLTRLSACVQSANDVIYPMNWQHIFIPVLPMALIDYLLAPMPFLIGVPDEVLQQVQRSEVGDVVILDADNDRIETPFDDLNSLPTEVVASLKKQLKNRAALLGDGVSRAFLRALVQLIGGYRDALVIKNGQKVTFNEASFIDTRPPSSQRFLKEMLHLQIFQQFIEERLDMLNSGQGFSDEFEIEACMYSDKSNSKLKQQYKEWTSSMKKEGTAFLRSVKDKANPAVKSAVKTVKDGGKGMKSAYRGLRSKLKENQNIQFQNGLDGTLDKPRSAPNSPTGKRRGFSVPTTTYRKDAFIKSSQVERPYSPLSPNSQPVSPERDEEKSRSISPNFFIDKIDLMNEMQDLLDLHLDTPPVDRSLKPVRSLENFKHSTAPPTAHHKPTTSPDRWLLPPNTTPSNHTNHTSPGSSLPPPVNRSTSQHTLIRDPRHVDTQNLLLQSPDDVFSSPPPVLSTPSSPTNQYGGYNCQQQQRHSSPSPAIATNTSSRVSMTMPTSRDLFGSAPFVVGGGRGENGQTVFLLANQHTVDVVRLSPPRRGGASSHGGGGGFSRGGSPASRKKPDDTEDLIRLNSSSDIEEFDPLKSPNPMSMSLPNHSDRFYMDNPLSISNPLYNYENHNVIRQQSHNVNVKQNGNATVSAMQQQQQPSPRAHSYSIKDQDLLQEYGIDFNRFNSFQTAAGTFENNGGGGGGGTTSGGKVNSQNQWTKFE